jgi:hypothetical protein
MFRSTRSIHNFNTFYALLFVLALAAGAFMLTHLQKLTPVTGANRAVSVASAADSHRWMDLGAGYWLETNAQGGQIIAPAMVVRPADKTFDLGAGYRLVITANGGQILSPARPSTYYKRTDLGAGYVLEETADYGRIIP